MTRAPADNTRVIYSHDYYIYEAGNFYGDKDKNAPIISPQAAFLGCSREMHEDQLIGIMQKSRQSITPTLMELLIPTATSLRPGIIKQEVAGVTSSSNEQIKVFKASCGESIHAPN